MKKLQITLPFWVRAILLTGVVCIFAGAGLISYRLYMQPKTLTIAVGSLRRRGQAGRLADRQPPCHHGCADPAEGRERRQRARCGQGFRRRHRRSCRGAGRRRRPAAGPRGRADRAWRGDDRGAAGIADHQHRQIARPYRRRGRRRDQSSRRRGLEEGIRSRPGQCHLQGHHATGCAQCHSDQGSQRAVAGDAAERTLSDFCQRPVSRRAPTHHRS